ncbi:hypothetical protein [Sandaracinus amylolyticus]|uniref:Uncharacterized protein n=1 Tax=Sandaracinus amylolyticus TaxID=927083 RepID=A0A0F6SHM8_9BACT|nr:hypothetical protein [Sandaracinus amylolyticus]AKF10719.1 hypothetical protein DB32_007868 [Sandaracinus amylolyticus]
MAETFDRGREPFGSGLSPRALKGALLGALLLLIVPTLLVIAMIAWSHATTHVEHQPSVEPAR